MKASYFLLESERFPSEWKYDGDTGPPPGHDFADSLLSRLLAAGVESTRDSVPTDWWEHSNWYFFVTWREIDHHLTIETAPMETSPPRWLVRVSKPLGTFRALFGNSSRNNALRHDIDEAFLRLVENCVMEVAEVDSVERITAEDAIDRLLDRVPKRREQDDAPKP